MKKLFCMAFAAFVLMGGGKRAAFANESLTSVGVAIPIMRYQDEYDNKAKGNGVYFALKEHYVFDSGFSLAADFGIGNMKVKDFYPVVWRDNSGNITRYEYQDGKAVYLNFDVGIGYALLNYQKFKLVLSALVGIGFQKYNKKYTYEETTDRFITFDAGLDLYATFKFTQHFGAFLSCKGMYSIGKRKHEYERNNVPWTTYDSDWSSKLKGFMITPSAGIVICF